MAAIFDHTSVVLIGTWNSAIVCPPWLIGEGIADTEDVDEELRAKFEPPGELFFTLGGIDWTVSNARLVIKSAEGKDCGKYAKAVLDKLGYTPISAVGTNFVFTANATDYPKEMLPSLGNLRVPETNEESDIRKVRTQVSKPLEDNSAVNLIVDHVADTITISYNMHRNVRTAAQAAQYTDGWASDRDTALKDLRENFQMEFPWPQL